MFCLFIFTVTGITLFLFCPVYVLNVLLFMCFKLVIFILFYYISKLSIICEKPVKNCFQANFYWLKHMIKAT